jgi:hypothetical protein
VHAKGTSRKEISNEHLRSLACSKLVVSNCQRRLALRDFWRDQGKRAAARDLLAPNYEWLTEGFETRDLQEAKALLDSL